MSYLHSLISRVNVPSPSAPKTILLITGGVAVEIPFVGSTNDSEDGWTIVGDHVRRGYILTYAHDSAVLTAPSAELEAAR